MEYKYLVSISVADDYLNKKIVNTFEEAQEIANNLREKFRGRGKTYPVSEIVWMSETDTRTIGYYITWDEEYYGADPEPVIEKIKIEAVEI